MAELSNNDLERVTEVSAPRKTEKRKEEGGGRGKKGEEEGRRGSRQTKTMVEFCLLNSVLGDGVTSRFLAVKNPHDSPNTDGFDPDSCSNVLIENLFVDSGDDGNCFVCSSMSTCIYLFNASHFCIFI